MKKAALLGVALSLSLQTAGRSADWNRFRGPNGSGVAASEGLPTEFDAASALWATDTIFGRSSPIVAGGRVFVTGLADDELTTIAIDAMGGEEVWRRNVPRRRVDAIFSEAGPSVATPVSDGANVYAFFPEFGLVSYDREGAERWRLELEPFHGYYGMAASPILEGGVLVLLCDQTKKP